MGQTPLQLRNPSDKGGVLTWASEGAVYWRVWRNRRENQKLPPRRRWPRPRQHGRRERERGDRRGGREKRARAGGPPLGVPVERLSIPNRFHGPTEPPFLSLCKQDQRGQRVSARVQNASCSRPLKKKERKKEIQGTRSPIGRSLPGLPLSCPDPSRTEKSPWPLQVEESPGTKYRPRQASDRRERGSSARGDPEERQPQTRAEVPAAPSRFPRPPSLTRGKQAGNRSGL